MGDEATRLQDMGLEDPHADGRTFNEDPLQQMCGKVIFCVAQPGEELADTCVHAVSRYGAKGLRVAYRQTHSPLQSKSPVRPQRTEATQRTNRQVKQAG
jgi:hypothetical protein